MSVESCLVYINLPSDISTLLMEYHDISIYSQKILLVSIIREIIYTFLYDFLRAD